MTRAPILVTGAGGFVCSEVAVAIHRAGSSVIAMDRQFDADTTARLSGLRCIEGDLHAMMTDEIGPLSAVIHGAAITASPGQLGISGAAHIRRNVDMLTATLDFARSTGAGRFLFISSMGVFDPDDLPAPGNHFTEATIPTAECTYCAAKHAGEILTASAAEDGFATLSLRLGNIFGPHESVRETRQHLCLAGRMLAEAREQGIITVQTPDALREWSWLPDLADAIARLLEREWTNPACMHAGTPPTISDLDLARAIASRVPGTTIRIAAPPHARIRPAMASESFDYVPWTAVEDALDQLVTQAVPS